MEIRVLEYFLAIADELNITRAAARLHITQPTLSRQMAELEQELGKELFIRKKKHLALSEEGIHLRKRAREIVDLANRTKDEFSNGLDSIEGNIYLGIGESNNMACLLDAYTSLRKTHPRIQLHLCSGDGMDLEERLSCGLLDFVVFFGEVDPVHFETLPLPDKEVWGVLYRKDLPVPQKEQLSPKDLAGLPVLLPRRPMDDPAFKDWLERDAGPLDSIGTFNLIYNAALAARMGMAAVITLEGLVQTEGTDLCFSLLHPLLEMPLTLAWRKHQPLSRCAALYLQELKARISSADSSDLCAEKEEL